MGRCNAQAPKLLVYPTYEIQENSIILNSQKISKSRKLFSKKVTRISKKGSYNTSPAWSPDSTMGAFTSSRKGSRTAIYRVRGGDTLTERQVSPKGMAAESPTWSPDGSMVAFQGWHKGDWKIFYVLSSGSSAERLTNSKQGIIETGPMWSSK